MTGSGLNDPNLHNGGIINPLYHGLTYNNKYPRILYVKPSNKVYVFYCFYVVLFTEKPFSGVCNKVSNSNSYSYVGWKYSPVINS